MADPKGRVSVRTQRSGKSIMNDEVLKDIDPPKSKPAISDRVSVRTKRSGASIMNDEVLQDAKRPELSERVKVRTQRPGSGAASEAPSGTSVTKTNTPMTSASSGGRGMGSTAGRAAGVAEDLAGDFAKLGRAGEGAALRRSAAYVGKQALKAVPGIGPMSMAADILTPTAVADATIKGNKEAEAAARAIARSQARPGGGTSAGRSDYKPSEVTPSRKPAAPPTAPGKPDRKPTPSLSMDDKVSQLVAKGYSRSDAQNLAAAKDTKVPAFSKGGLVGKGKPVAKPAAKGKAMPMKGKSMPKGKC